MELATRWIHFAGSTSNPDEPWMLQVARNARDAEDGFLREKRHMLMDRDTKVSEAFRSFWRKVAFRLSGYRRALQI
jgi:hypothetical protein